MRRLPAWLIAFSALLAAGHARAAGGVLVMNSRSASLSVIDMSSEKEVRRIPVLREPHHVMLTPDGRDLLVGDTVGNQILDLDPSTFVVRRRMTISDPYQLGFSPDARYLVVNGLARAQVDIYDGHDYHLVKRFDIASMPSHMAFTPDSATVFISLQGTDSLVAIDLRSMKIRWKAHIGSAPAGVLWHDGSVLVALMGGNDVVVVDPANGRVTRRIVTGRGAHQLFPSPDGKLIYVNNRVDSTAVALDARTLKEVRSYKLPGGPDDLVFAPDGHIWFTMRFAHRVAVLNPATGDVRTIEVGRSPHGIFLNAAATVK
ncbi:MAG: PQQ-binding-like beta-propeller repeat protein [Rhodospirillales bacterium]|nr:PQQ-binding-like beta-propeller repeat protein [Rhodospirillales bacterium]MDE2577022.1 PQQ-binding-like beta-propeller repeat protein [Rhodospirillales bacterium]